MIEQEVVEGTTDAILRFDGMEITLNLVKDFPTIDEIKGVQARLNNLGYEVGRVDGKAGKLTEAGIRAFQRDHEGSKASGQINKETKNRIKSAHGV